MRLFTAITMPEPTLSAVLAYQGALRDHADFKRWQTRPQLHLTLHFIGELDPERLPAVEEVLAASARHHGPFELALGGLGHFADRVAWLGIEGDVPPLVALQADLATALRSAGVPLEERRYRPHITLARDARTRPDWQGLAATLPAPEAAWTVSDVALFQSELLPSGARHTVLARFPLDATGSP